MKILKLFLLLILSVTIGCGASSKVRGCLGGWVEFTCNYSKKHEKYQKVIELLKSKETVFQGHTVEFNNGKFFLYRDEKSQNVRVTIKNLTSSDKGDYSYKFKGSKPNGKTEVEVESDRCQAPLHQITYRSAETTITCDYVQDEEEKRPAVPFFCKEEADTCVDVSIKSKGKFTFAHSSRAFNLSFSNVQVTDRGVYWCGLNSSDGKHRSGLRRIQLEVKGITSFKRSPAVGQNFTYWCNYPKGLLTAKFICKGEDPSICQPLVSTAQHGMTAGKFSITDNKTTGNITVTVRNLTTDNTGTYWCGTNKTFFNKVTMTVVTSSTTAPSATPPTERHGSFQAVTTVFICVAVLMLLLLMITLITIYKRFIHTFRHTAAAQHNIEDVYEEIEEPLQTPHTDHATNSVYALLSFPTNPSASLHYATVNIQGRRQSADS